jgi:hypothetical protein
VNLGALPWSSGGEYGDCDLIQVWG